MLTRKLDATKNPVAFVFFNAKTDSSGKVVKSAFVADFPVAPDAGIKEAMDVFENSEMGIQGYVAGSAEPYLLVLPSGKIAADMLAAR